MELIRELLQLNELADTQLQKMRDDLHKLHDQVEDIEGVGGEIPPSLAQKIKQLKDRIDAKKKQLGYQVKKPM